MRGVRQDTCVSGEEWLRDTLEVALRTCKPPYEQLGTELQTLSDSGLLSDKEATRARARLDEDMRNQYMMLRGRTQRAFAEASDKADQDRLEETLTPERTLGAVEGVTVVLMRVELWTSRLILRLEALQNEVTDALDAAFDTEWKAWERRWIEDRAAAEAEDLRPPERPSVPRLAELPLSVADDVGTRYHAVRTSTGGSEHPWRSEWRLEPGAPSLASVLRIALEDGEPERERLELALPSRT
jgi:hypothetical protein